MKTYQFNINGQYEDAVNQDKYFVKTDAEVTVIEEAIEFIQKGEVSVDKLLQAIRILGYKATEVKIEPVETFEL